MTEAVTPADTDTLYCANHPQVETSLRCNKCGKPICTRCAVRTPVGYRCRECVRSQQAVFETARWWDYAIAIVIAAPLAGVTGAILSNLGFFMFFLAPVAGGVIAEIIRWAVRRRRGRYLALTAAGGFVLGCLPLILGPAVVLLLSGLAGADLGSVMGGALLAGLWPTIYCVIAASTLYARLRGISV